MDRGLNGMLGDNVRQLWDMGKRQFATVGSYQLLHWSGRGIWRRKVCIYTVIYTGTSKLVHDVIFPALGLSSYRIVSVIDIVDRCN